MYTSKAKQSDVTVQDFTAKNAPLIKKYKHFCPEGYGFVYIENNEVEAVFKKKCNYNTFTGLSLMKP